MRWRKKMTLSSPSKNTSIELGPEGIVQKTDKDWNISALAKKYEYILGDVEFKVDGTTAKIHGGANVDIFGGLKSSTFIGGSNSNNFGFDASIKWSYSTSTTYGKTWTYHKAKEERESDERVEKVITFYALNIGTFFNVEAKEEIVIGTEHSHIKIEDGKITLKSDIIVVDGHVRIKKDTAIDGELVAGKNFHAK